MYDAYVKKVLATPGVSVRMEGSHEEGVKLFQVSVDH